MTPEGSSARKTYAFAGYEVQGVAGSGGMGVVYHAQDSALGRAVALKVLREDLRSQSHLVARFKREAEAVAQLDHPNIVHIYSVGAVSGIPYIAMELIQGRPLSGILKEQAPLPWRQVLQIGAQVAGALACAHEARIIHRDIKPANILMSEEGKAYVTDFGIAKVLNAVTQLTADGSRLGTPQYMSPERCRNQEITPLSDIYALGVLLFQSMTGRLPHEGSNPADLIQKIIAEPAARVRDYSPELPEEVDRLVSYMLEKNPKDRPQDANAVCGYIDRILEGKGLEDPHEDMLDALATFRKSISPETPANGVFDAPTRFIKERKTSLAYHLYRQYQNFGRRTVLIGGGLLSLLILSTVLVGLAVGFSTPTTAGPEASVLSFAWREVPPLAAFREETKGVSIARVALADFQMERAFFAPEAGRGFCALHGCDGTQRAGEWIACVFDLSVEEMRMLSLPQSYEASAMPRLVGSLPTDSGSSGALISDQRRGYGLLEGGVGLGETRFEGSLEDWVTSASGASYLMTLRPGNSAKTILAWGEVASDQPPQLLAEFNQTLQGMSCSQDGSVFACATHEQGSGSLLLYTRTADGNYQESRLAQGDFQLNPAAFSPDGSQLVACKQEEGQRLLEIYDIPSASLRSTLGNAQEAAWSADGAALIYTAQDRAGRLQLWAAQAQAPYAARQLTFLGQGVDSTFSVQEKQVLCSIASPPQLVFVSLEQVF